MPIDFERLAVEMVAWLANCLLVEILLLLLYYYALLALPCLCMAGRFDEPKKIHGSLITPTLRSFINQSMLSPPWLLRSHYDARQSGRRRHGRPEARETYRHI